MEVYQNVVKTEKWSYGLCKCFDNWALCCVAYIAGPVLFGRTAEALGQGCVRAGCIYGFIPIYNLCIAADQRELIRGLRGISGSRAGDCCAVYFCGMCANVQHAREISSINEELGIQQKPLPVNPDNVEKTGKFEYGLFGCFQDGPVCATGFCYPPVLFGEMGAAMGKSCVKEGCLFGIPIVNCIVSARRRAAIREMRNISGSCCGDWLITSCLPACALVQQAREVQLMQQENAGQGGVELDHVNPDFSNGGMEDKPDYSSEEGSSRPPTPKPDYSSDEDDMERE